MIFVGKAKTGKDDVALADDIILPDMKTERKATEVARSWINSRFQLLDGHGKPMPPIRIPYKCVNVPISQAILQDTGIKCAQVRGMQSTPSYEKAFIKMGEWDTQFPGGHGRCH